MKKTVVVVVVVLVLLLGVAPWGIGRVAEQRVNAGLDRFLQEAPYLSIIERKWTPGWFRSEQVVTFEVLGPWMRALNPATVLADIEKAEKNAAADESAQQLEAAPPKVSAEPAAAHEAGSADGAEAPLAEPPAADFPPIRFTVHNEILHGPVLWPASFGFARINTRLVMSEEIRKGLMEIFGTDEPVKLSSRVGFLGGGSTRLYGDGRTVKMKDEPGELKYDDFEFKIGFSKNFDDVDFDGSWPKLEVSNGKSGEQLAIDGISLVGESERALGDLYESTFKFAIDAIHFVDAGNQETTVENIHYAVVSNFDKGYMDAAAKLGSGKIKSPALAQLNFELNETHYDFSLRHLHAETLQKLVSSIKLAYTKPVSTAADVQTAVMAPFKEHGIALLKHEPEFVIDRLGIVSPEGEGYIKGVIRLKGVTEADFQEGGNGWVSKVDADITVEVPQKLVEKFPNGATGAGLAMDQGFVRRDGEKLVSHIEFKNQELKINGKSQPIPGFGQGPPPDHMGSDPVPGEE